MGSCPISETHLGLLSEFPWEVCAGLPGCVGVAVTLHVRTCFSMATPPRSQPLVLPVAARASDCLCLHQWFLCKRHKYTPLPTPHPSHDKNPTVMFYFHGSLGERIHSLLERFVCFFYSWNCFSSSRCLWSPSHCQENFIVQSFRVPAAVLSKRTPCVFWRHQNAYSTTLGKELRRRWVLQSRFDNQWVGGGGARPRGFI